MRRARIALAALAALRLAALAGEATAGRPQGATAVGTVTGRLGNCVVVRLAEGATLAPGGELLVGRPTLLVALAKGEERAEAWGNWEEAGRIQVRLLRGTRYCIAFVATETTRTGVDGKPAPNIRPGDLVCRETAPARPTPGP